MLDVNDIIANFALLDDWNERYRYLIELGRELDPLPEAAHTEVNRVKGCASQVWLETNVLQRDGEPVLNFRGDSDAHIVKGLIYLALALYGNRSAREIEKIDAVALFSELGLSEHLTPQRSNGFKSMVDRIRRDARNVLAQGSS